MCRADNRNACREGIPREVYMDVGSTQEDVYKDEFLSVTLHNSLEMLLWTGL